LANPWVKGPEPDSIFNYGSDPDQLIEFFGSTGPTVVAIHGGYWRSIHNREHMRAFAAKLSGFGFKVANIEYRREALSPNKTISDVNSALMSLDNPLAVLGFSVGGQLALICTEQMTTLRKLILLAPVTDLQRTKREALGDQAVSEFFGDMNLDIFDPMKRDYQSNIYIIHGDADQRVPIEHSRDFAKSTKSTKSTESTKSKSVTLIELPSVDHFGVIDPNGSAFELTLELLAKP
jgi:acetyl esterase/lipase